MRPAFLLPLLLAAMVLASAGAAQAQNTYVASTFTQGMTPLTGGTMLFPNNYTLSTFTQGMTPLTSGTVLMNTGTSTYVVGTSVSNFNFRYFGSTFTSFLVYRYGYVVLRSSASGSAANTALPSTAGPDYVVAPFWDDLVLDAGGTGKVWMQVQGTAPNRVVVIEYYRMNFNGQGSTYYITAQIQLHETTNVIEFHYDTNNQNWGTGIYSASIGIEDATETIGIDAAGNSPNVSSCPTVNYRFTYQSEDDNSAAVALPFTFNHFGSACNTVYISTNGFVTFANSGTTNPANDAIPSTNAPDDHVALFWDDLEILPGNGAFDCIKYQVLGNTPVRDFVIEYSYVTRKGQTTSEMTGQIHLFETSNRIELHYALGGANTWVGVSATIGIEDSAGANGFGGPNTGNTNGTCPAVNYRFDPAYTLTVASAQGSPSPAVGTFAYVPGTPLTCSVGSPVAGGAGTQYSCSGWTGTGSASPTGQGTSTTFTLLADTAITWNWITEYQLNLSANPGAGGSVSHNQPANWIAAGTTVTLSAVPATGYSFAQWSGSQSSTSNPHSFSMTGPMTVTGDFNVAQVALVVSGNPSQTGTPSPGYGVNYYSFGTLVNASVTSPVTGPAGTRYVCTGWTGTGDVPATGAGPSASFTINQLSSLTWTWVTEYQLTLQESPSGAGTVQASPTGPWIAAGTPVTVTATPTGSYNFSNWSGALSSSTNPDIFTLNGPSLATANFQVSGPSLTVSSAFGSPTPAVGTAVYAAGTALTCSVTSPVDGPSGVRYVCTGWTGTGDLPASGSSTSVSITLNTTSSLTWNWTTQYSLAASETPAGAGTVYSNPSGPWIAAGATVSLTAVPASGFEFISWGGSLQTPQNPATILMDSPKTISAEFLGDYGLAVSAGPANPGGTPESATAQNVPALQASLRAGSGDGVRVLSVRVWVTGPSNEILTVTGVRLFLDDDADGYFGGTETEIGTLQTLSGDDGSATFTATPAITIPAGGTVNLLAVLDLNAAAGDTFQASIAGASDVSAVLDVLGTGVTAAGLPVTGGIKTVAAPGAPGSLSVSIGPDSPAWRRVKAGASGIAVLQFVTRTSSVENVNLASVTLSAQGSGDDALGILRAQLYGDTDLDGELDTGDLLLGSSTFAADDGTATFSGLGVVLPAGGRSAFLLVVDLSTGATGEFAFGLADSDDVSASGASSAAAIAAAVAPFWGEGVEATQGTVMEPTFFTGGCSGGRGSDPWLAAMVLFAALALVLRARRGLSASGLLIAILVPAAVAAAGASAPAFGAETGGARISSFADLSGLLETPPARTPPASGLVPILQDWGWDDKPATGEKKPEEAAPEAGAPAEEARPGGSEGIAPGGGELAGGAPEGGDNRFFARNTRIGLEFGGFIPVGAMEEPFSSGHVAGLFLGFGLPSVLGEFTPTAELRLTEGMTRSIDQEKGFDLSTTLVGARLDLLFHLRPKSKAFNLFFFLGAGMMLEMSSGTAADPDTGETMSASKTYPFFVVDSGIGAWLNLTGPLDLFLRLEFDMIPVSKNVSAFALGELGLQARF